MFIKKAGVLPVGACIGHGMVLRRVRIPLLKLPHCAWNGRMV
jgi:hypothetical protein